MPGAIFATMLDWVIVRAKEDETVFYLFEMHLTFSLVRAVFGLLLPLLYSACWIAT